MSCLFADRQREVHSLAPHKDPIESHPADTVTRARSAAR